MHFILYLVLVGGEYSVFYNEFWCKWIKIRIKSCGNEQKALPLHSQLRNIVGAIAQMVEQRTDIVYKLALCPRFDSWWHHNYFFLKRQY